ncbi:MAG: hypothetical protein CMA10_06325 [Euryarchaeota archaeon]|nr:hypothetical protein [Euryarchaeota archaeon]
MHGLKAIYPKPWCLASKKTRLLFNHSNRTIRKDGAPVSNMMLASKQRRTSAVVAVGLFLMSMLSGCIDALDTTVTPRATLEAYPTLIQEGEMVTLDARGSSAVEGVITGYTWDFGDGSTAETVVGFTSHAFPKFGQYSIRLTVTNDQGGTDDAVATVIVNGAPVINLSMPPSVRAGDTALFDASQSYDPEGGLLTFSWDFDPKVDTNGDGDPENDLDALTPEVLLPTEKSGMISGILRIDDNDGAFSTEAFELNITTRTFKVVWVTEKIQISWDEYLEQGQSWEGNMTPGDNGRVIAFDAVLELDEEDVPPHDNFTLFVHIVDDNFRDNAQTEGNYTNNQPVRAEITLGDMNAPGEEGLFVADSEEEVIRLLLNDEGNSSGQGIWLWSVAAKQAEPDSLFGEFDPDPGNDWVLTVEITVSRPSLTEVATSE